MSKRRTRAQCALDLNASPSSSSEAESKATEKLNNHMSAKQLRAKKSDVIQTKKNVKQTVKKSGERKVKEEQERRKSTRISPLAKVNTETEDYQADIENNTDSTSQSGPNNSPAPDMYDFSTSEDDFKLQLSPDKPVQKKTSKATKPFTAKPSKKSPKSPLTEIVKPNSVLYKLKGIGKPVKGEKKTAPVVQTKALKRPAETDNKTPEIISDRSLKKQKRSSVSFAADSGVFMTPSPLHAGSTTGSFQVSFDKGHVKVTGTTSTPSADSVHPHTTSPDTFYGSSSKVLKASRATPLNLSPVKKVISPNTGGVHGALLTSMAADDTPAPSPIPHMPPPHYRLPTSPSLKRKAPMAPDTEEDEAEMFKALDISKTYDGFTDIPKKKVKKCTKSNKGRPSMSGYEEWADKKASEFDEIEMFELSIESC